MISNCFKVRSLFLSAAQAVILGFVSPAFGQFTASYVVDSKSGSWVELGNFGGYNTFAEAINDVGQVVGSSETAKGDRHAFITGPNGVGIRDLGTFGGPSSQALDINLSGQVTGYSSHYSSHGNNYSTVFITGPNGLGMTDLGAATVLYHEAVASINNSGQIVGEFSVGGFHYYHAFLTGPNGKGITDLGSLSYTDGPSVATGINTFAQVVGYSESHAFITGPNGTGMRDLGTLRGGASAATDINDAGQVVGSSDAHAFITGPGGLNMRDLGTLNLEDPFESFATAVNEAGQVVGSSRTRWGESHAFITGPDGEGMTDLNSLVDLPDGVILTEARDINNLGQVVVIASTPIPEPEIYALLLAGLGVVGFMTRRKK